MSRQNGQTEYWREGRDNKHPRFKQWENVGSIADATLNNPMAHTACVIKCLISERGVKFASSGMLGSREDLPSSQPCPTLSVPPRQLVLYLISRWQMAVALIRWLKHNPVTTCKHRSGPISARVSCRCGQARVPTPEEDIWGERGDLDLGEG